MLRISISQLFQEHIYAVVRYFLKPRNALQSLACSPRGIAVTPSGV